ncbi:MAG TPA: Ig-like domain-containing protein [Mobilitalea sp.]|nr:Ig-like domain-containing protein [Mobilitalea sp.]
MIKTGKLGITLLFSCFLAFIIFCFTGITAEASSVVLPTQYYFVFNGQQKTAGSEYEMTMSEVLLNVTAGTWEPETTVQWVSSEPGVISLESTTYGSNFVKLVRQGPGYSTITAVIKQGTNSYSISCVVKVALSFDYQKTGMITTTTTKERVLVLDTIGSQKPVYLKYVDYTPDGSPTAVSGSAISVNAVNWDSSDEGVATVDSTGKITAVGAGSSTITVTSNTMSTQDKPMAITMKVVVKPDFSLSFTDSSNTPVTYHSAEDNSTSSAVATGVPSNFVINSNAALGTNLKWEVYDCSTKTIITAGSTGKLTYTVSSMSGNVSFSNVKAGTYEIYAFADQKYNVNTNAPYAYMKLVVPITLKDINLVMTVGDTYNLIDNSNITGIGMFGEPVYVVGSQNTALFDTSKYIITAKSKGSVSIKLTYQTSLKLFDTVVPDITINVTVIDGIALSASSATLYTKGTLLLNAIVTDPTVPITWTSSDPAVASVTDGLVTGLKVGTTTITANQTINGVTKKAICKITVQQSVTSIVIDPATSTLDINAYVTLHATITPSNLLDVNLKWKSSNDNVVKIIESSALTATIQGVAGGTAVISAINQDNVVVGYCHVKVQQPVTSIVLSETAVTVSLASKTLQLRASVYPDNALNKTVNWTSSDTTKATVDANGRVTLLKAGTVTIIATSADSPAVTAMCNLSIDVPVVSLALDETTKTMYVGQSARLTYTLLPANASNNSVTWTSTNTSVVTVDATGKVTAKSVGSSVVILKTADGGYTVYCTITVKQVATAVTFDVSVLNLKKGEYYYIKTTLTPKNSTDNGLIWESSDTKVATVDANGKVVAKDAGSAIIMARTEVGGVAYCKVNVTQPVNSLLLNFSEKTIFVGNKFQLEVSVTPSTASQLGVTWKSSNDKVAKVNNKGEVTGIIGGTAVITCVTVDGGFQATCVVTVKEPVTTIKLDYDTYNLGLAKNFKLTATVTSDTATDQKVVWSSSNEKVATVNQKGKVTGISKGYATITATATDGSDVEASCEVRIVTPVDSIDISKSYMTLIVGDAKTLKATIKPAKATFRKAIWSSSDPTVAIVDDNGVVTALKAGNATIVAETQDSNGKKAICYVVVYDRLPATGITLQDKKLTMVSGEDKVVQLVLIPAASTDGYTWSTDNPAVATVNKKTGRITAKSIGTAYITVMTDSGKTATVEVTVIGLNMTSLTLEQYTTYPYPLEVQGATTAVKWSVDNPQVAVVTNGYVSSRSVGTATITAIVNGRKLTCKITVVKIN